MNKYELGTWNLKGLVANPKSHAFEKQIQLVERKEKNAKRLIKDSGELSGYLKYKRLVAKYSLSEPEERIINTLDVTGSTALIKLYDKITNAFEYVVKIEGKKRKLTREQLSTYVRSTKSKTREIAYKE